MPQLPNSSTEDLGADDEVKEYKQEDGEDSENGTHLDLVNDIKSDLIKKETENSEVSRPFYNFIRKPSRFKARLIFSCKLADFLSALRFGVAASNFGSLDRGTVASGVLKVSNIESYCLEI